MNKKLEKVRKDIEKTKKKIAELAEYLKVLKERERQLEDDEIITRIRSLQKEGTDIMDVLEGVKAPPQVSVIQNQPYRKEVPNDEK